MSGSIISVLKWTIPISLVIGWTLRAVLLNSYYESVMGIGMAITFLILILKRHSAQRVLWHEEDKVLTVIRPWIVEASTALLLTTVPIGIDLSKSASTVLASMSARLSTSKIPVELRFFVARPLRNYPTIIGFMISRKLPRLKGTTVAEILRKVIKEDRDFLHGIMRSVYHHVPVETASQSNMLLINSGGAWHIG
jgi:hypothetical protein